MRPASLVRGAAVLMAATALTALVACTERQQTMSDPVAKKGDSKPWDGAEAAYTVPGWTQGDRGSWERQLQARNQLQNEYQRVR